MITFEWKKKLNARNIEATYINDQVKTFAHLELWRICCPYVPRDTGTLMQYVEITPEYLRYAVPYAERLYYGTKMNFRTDKNPLATAYWDKAAMKTQREKLVRAVEKYARQHTKKGVKI